MTSPFSSPTDGPRRPLGDLLDEYDNWRGVMEHAGSGEFDGVEKIVALYRFAIANYDDPRIDLVLELIEAVEKAGDTF
ncbi:hypothetical protein [Mycolicibacterium sp.]|uniref:hypothetical protein n=1 Tax=Mycolicibacterium sp. TaxID=2320850 RepID=UPI0037C89BE5